MSLENLRFTQNDSMRCLMSSHQVYFLAGDMSSHSSIVLQASYTELVFAATIIEGKF